MIGDIAHILRFLFAFHKYNLLRNFLYLFVSTLFCTLKSLSKSIRRQYIYIKYRTMKIFFILFLASLISFSLAERCKHPQVASNYKNSLYAGRWYEIGKVSNN